MNLLGNLQVPGSDLSYSTPQLSSQFDVTSVPHQIDPALLQGIPSGAAQPQQHHGPFGGGFGNVLGRIGDALLVATGHEPQYAPRMQQRKIGALLANYLGNTDSGLAQLFAESPEVGLALYKMQHPATEIPAALREYQYYQKLPAGEQASFLKFRQAMSPQIMSPLTLPDNATLQMPGQTGAALPHVTDQASYDAVPPGAQYTAPDGHVRVKGGAAPSNGPLTFR